MFLPMHHFFFLFSFWCFPLFCNSGFTWIYLLTFVVVQRLLFDLKFLSYPSNWSAFRVWADYSFRGFFLFSNYRLNCIFLQTILIDQQFLFELNLTLDVSPSSVIIHWLAFSFTHNWTTIIVSAESLNVCPSSVIIVWASFFFGYIRFSENLVWAEDYLICFS